MCGGMHYGNVTMYASACCITTTRPGCAVLLVLPTCTAAPGALLDHQLKNKIAISSHQPANITQQKDIHQHVDTTASMEGRVGTHAPPKQCLVVSTTLN